MFLWWCTVIFSMFVVVIVMLAMEDSGYSFWFRWSCYIAASFIANVTFQLFVGFVGYMVS